MTIHTHIVGVSGTLAGVNNQNELLVDASSSFSAAGLATETTQLLLATEATLQAVQSLLSSIVNTSGINQIVQPLPAGTNLLGQVQLASVSGTNLASINNFNELNVSITNENTVGIDYVKDNITNNSYYLLIDLDNGGGAGPYKHSGTGGVKLHWLHGHLLKDDPLSQWNVLLLVVLRIDGVDADLAAIETSSLHLDDNLLFEVESTKNFTPQVLDLSVLSGSLSKLSVADIRTNIATINTSITLEDIAGNSVTPAVGDVLVFAEKTSAGTSNIKFHYTTIYEVT